MRNINEIIIHASATKPDWMAGKPTSAKVMEIDRWHRDNGWSGIGYHYVIDRDGTRSPGRDLGAVGAHTQGHNHNTIGVCLLGGYGSNEKDEFADNYTAAQDRALREFIAEMRGDIPTINKISGHNEFAAKACPGFSVADWLKTPAVDYVITEPEPRKLRDSTTLQATAATAAAAAGTVATGVSKLEGTSQIIVIVAGIVMALGLAWIARERIKAWGDR